MTLRHQHTKARLAIIGAAFVAAAAAANAQSISTGFGGSGSNAGEPWNGNFFDLTVTNPGGITIDSWDVHLNEPAGMPLSIRIYYKEGTYVGHHSQIGQWVLHGEAPVTSAGPGAPTPVSLGGLNLDHDTTYGIRIGVSAGRMRYDNLNTMVTPVFNDDLRLDLGAAQGSHFGLDIIQPRGWNGTIYYTAHGTVPEGACCLSDGSCIIRTEIMCEHEGGTYQGDNTDCTITCPQPTTGACCFEDASCIMTWEGGCLAQGGLYHGDNTDCAAIQCARGLTTTYSGGSSATRVGAGAFFTATALDPQGITVEHFHINSAADAGTPIDVHVYYKPGEWLTYEREPSAWTLLGEVQTIAAGQGERTQVPIGGLAIAHGETWSFRVGVLIGGIRHNSSSTTVPVHSDDHLQINLGAVQTLLWDGSLLNPRGWNGTLFYTIGATVTTGACCLPDGSCEQRTEPICLSDGGVYHGDNTPCTAVACPQRGACCLPDGTCLSVIESVCTNDFDGNFRGENSTCGDQRCAALPVLWNNGPLVTHHAHGCNGGDVSMLEQNIGTNTYGFNWTYPNLAVADDFSIPQGEVWEIEELVFWGYQTGEPNISFSTVMAQIWDGRPGDPGSNVIAGDIHTSCLTAANFTDIYRASSSAWLSCERRLVELRCDLPVALSGGTYWIEATATGWGASGPWMPPVKFLGHLNKPFPNARQRTSTGWQDLAETGSGIAHEIPFLIIGTVDAPCYADCDGNELLNIDDFVCFINEFSQAQSLPPAQQISHYANCDGSTTEPILTIDDFICFINAFSQGCP